MKRLLYPCFCLTMILLTFTACGNEDELTNRVDFSSPYVIEDNPNDPIQHRRYLIYKEYGVPVFFQDTISETLLGYGHDGNPIYRYETLDLNWSFSGHDNGKVEYEMDYLTESELQETALDFAEEFLRNISRPMRPFSIFLPGNLTVKKTGKAPETPDFWSGFRTLVIPNVQEKTEEEIPDFSLQIIRSMVKGKVKGNSELVALFGESATKGQWYDKPWELKDNNGGLGCDWGPRNGAVTVWKPRDLYLPTITNSFGTYNRIDYYIMMGYVSNEEEFYEVRARVYQQIGRFGFICGGESDGFGDQLYSPKSLDVDIDYYLDKILELGGEEFLNRYGASSLVAQKYTILSDYIENVLGVEL